MNNNIITEEEKTEPIYSHQDETKLFVEKGLWDNKQKFGECASIGFANKKNGLVAGIVYHNYEPQNQVIEISAFSSQRKWLTKKYVKLIFAYPFEQLNLRLVVARCDEDNYRVRKIWKTLGASEAILPEMRGENKNEVVLLLKKNQWNNSKFMRKQNG